MQTIQTKVQIKADRTLTVQLPAETQVGEYDVELILKNSTLDSTQAPETDDSEKNDRDAAWKKWVEEVEQLPISTASAPEEDSYQQHIIEKYRKQGLNL